MNTHQGSFFSSRWLSIPGVAVGLLLLWFGALLLPGAAAQADGAILRVPTDYATIQEAIDAAQEGDEIRIVGAFVEDSLFVSKSITLSGGWNSAFTGTSRSYTLVDPQGLGRGITISGTGAGIDVTISGFAVLNGDATGLGGAAIDDPSLAAGTASLASLATAPLASPAELASLAVAQAQGLADAGNFPGGTAALPDALVRLKRLTSLAGENPAVFASSPGVAGVADCGGAIYAHGASLKLSDSLLGKDTEPNIASRIGVGAGGGLCAVDVPEGGLHLDGVVIANNIASSAGIGIGGGVFISGTTESGVSVRDFFIVNNIAGKGGSGAGGGVYLRNAPGATFEGGGFQYNLAAATGARGYGGGLALMNSPRTALTQVDFTANSANTAWSPVGLSIAVGFGGGMSLVDSDNVVLVQDVTFLQNQAGLHGEGVGGALYAKGGKGLRIDGAEFTDNWAIVYPLQFEGGQSGGGAISLQRTQDTQITARLTGNRTAFFNHYCQDLYGAALQGVGVVDFRLAGSELRANTGGACDEAERPVAHGAATFVSGSRNITITNNNFAENVTELGNFVGDGGALYLEGAVDVSIRLNDFLSNTGGVGGGVGGALTIENSAAVLIDGNRMIGNHAAAAETPQFALGGAIAINRSDHLRIVNNLLAGNVANSGAAMILVGNTEVETSTVEVANNTVYANLGANGVSLRQWTTPLTLTNNLIVSHTLGIEVESGAAALRYTLYDGNGGNAGGAGEIDESHAVSGTAGLMDAANNDFHLLPTSAAIDAGDPSGVPPAPPVDIEETPRPYGPHVDIGAYEWHGPQLYLPVIFRQTPVLVGWAVGQDRNNAAVIVGTIDGGRTWQLQKSAPGWAGLDAGDISAVDEQTAWAALVSAPGAVRDAIVHTTDGGATWVTQTLPAGVTGGVKSIKGLSRSEAWATSMSGVILHTTDGGASWAITPNATTPITQINRMDAMGQHVWIADSDDQGAVVYSHDAGLTWQVAHLDNNGQPDTPLTVHAASAQVVWASGTESLTFYRSLDGGADWAKVISVGGFDHLDDICGSSEEHIWGVTNGGGVDGRIKRVSAPAVGDPQAFDVTPEALRGYMPGGVTCLDQHVAWVVGQQGPVPDPAKADGVILYTTDGQTWTKATAPEDVHLWKITMSGARR